MSKLNSLLSKRLQSTTNLSKMKELAEKSSQGNLSSFSGVFKISPLSSLEQQKIENILNSYKKNSDNLKTDLVQLLNITSEVKAINNQAIMLHGERIKKAQIILKNYKDGAFSAWLIATYGNRQTPYNFLQYYELFQQIPPSLAQKFDEMPKQAIYTLASRPASLEQKKSLIQNYKGETKEQILTLIRQKFPLHEKDMRAQNLINQTNKHLEHIASILKNPSFQPTPAQKKQIKLLLKDLLSRLN